MSHQNDTQASTKTTATTSKQSAGFTPEERAAMKERVREKRAASRRDSARAGIVEVVGTSNNAR